MAFIEWDEKLYSVGMTKMDEQHKVLVGLLNALYEKKSEPSDEFIEKIMNTLIQYTQNHFKDEERILEKIRFSNIEKHKQQHQRFIAKVQEMSQNLQSSGDIVETLDELLLFLRKWLMNHILIEDMSYKKYLFDD